jgi:small subunit ribosomal protein S16
MLTIRLSRQGTHKRPFYYVTVSESSSPRDGRFVERIGFFNPLARGAEQGLRLDIARAEHWVARGAQMSSRVATLVDQARRLATATPA